MAILRQPHGCWSGKRLAHLVGCDRATASRVADKLAAAGAVVTHYRGRIRCFSVAPECLAPPAGPPPRRHRQKPSISADDCTNAHNSEATFGSVAECKSWTPAYIEAARAKEEQGPKADGNATNIARCARLSAPEPVASPEPPTPAAEAEKRHASSPGLAAGKSGTGQADAPSLIRYRQNGWLYALTQFAGQQHDREAVQRCIEAQLILADRALTKADKMLLEDLDRRMRAAGFKPDRRQPRFQRRRSAAAPVIRSRRSPEDKLRIREMQIGKHYRCLLARRGVEVAAAYSEQVAPLLGGQGDVAAAKALFEQVDRWMRHVIGWDDMRQWKAAHRDELGKVHRYGRAA